MTSLPGLPSLQVSCILEREETEGDRPHEPCPAETFRRVDHEAAPHVPDAWQKFVGSYGPDFIPLVVSVKHGHLYAMTENMADYRLTPINRTVFRMPPGLYEDEQLVFQLSPDGSVHGVVLAGMVLHRTNP